ncbi:MAG: hypothetical protein J6T74_00810, partial [Clostridia bacterium]|nr:hypothetical protein [Clostridia bacterium]
YNFAITIEDYNKGLTKNNVFLKYETSDGTQYVKCADVKINQRYTVTYAGELVDYNYHNDIISIQEAIIVSELEDGLAPNNEYACLQSVIYKNSSSGNTLVLAELQYVVVCDITINNIDENNDDYDIQLNANEYPNGLSLVNILDIVKSNSRNLWCNDVDNEKTLTITEKGSSSNASEKSIRTYGIEVGDGIVFDYNINAVGAKNNGTIVTYELRYTVVEGGISFVYAKNFKVKVLSDVEFMLKNNDFTSTDNSQDHMLKISTTGTIMLVNGSQTNGDGTAYYVYAYGRYNENKTNIAARFNINVNGGDYAELLGNYLTVDDGEYYTKTNNSIYITCEALPTFGNKEIVIEFTDLYDFTFSYYIVFEASADIDSSSITTQTIYEGDTISVFNKRNNSGLDGIGFIFKNIDGDIIEDQSVFLQNAYIIVPENAKSEAFVGGGGYDGIVKVAGNEIKFNYADWDSTHWAGNQTFWECYGNGSQVALTLRVIISGEDTEGAETYFRDYPIFYTKRYSMSLEEENTYVRDGVEFNMENLISVMDNKNSRYLGEPKIYDADAYKLDAIDSTYGGIQINELYDYGTGDEYPVEFKYDYKYKDPEYPEDSTKKITAEASYYISKFNVYNMMLYLADNADAVTDATTFKVDGPDDYDSVGNNNTINYSMTINKDFVAAVLKELGIEQSPTDKTIFTLSLNIGLRNNNTSKTANIVREFRLNIEQVHSDPATISAIVGDSDNYIVLGSYQPEPVLEDVTFDNTTFKLYTVLDGENEISWTGPEDKASLIKAKAGLLSNGITHTSVKLLDISISDKVDGDGINVIIKTSDGKLHAENIKSSTTLTSMIILSDGKYLGKNPELYTGYYTESSGNYTVAGLEGTQCFNGLTIDDVKQAKFLHSVYMNDLYTNKLDLEKDKAFFTSSKYGVDYQSKSVIIKYELYEKAGYLYSFSANANVTLKYTGINTDDAYIGNSSIHYIEFSASANVDDENATVNEKQLTVSLISSDSFVGDGTTVISSKNIISHNVVDVLVDGVQLASYSVDKTNGIITFNDPVAAGKIIVVKYGGLVWGDEFKLTPGVGKVATLAYSAKEDLSLQSLGLLKYELTGVYAGSNTTTSSVASIDQTTGILTLMEGYRLNDYYISIRISCAYPSDDLGDYEYRPIGTVNVGFRYTIST